MAKEKATRLDLSGLDIKGIINSLNAKYGKNTLILASKAKGLKVSFVSTGVYALDFGTGGGFPENRIVELRGPFSSLKTTISITSAVNFQKQYSNGAVVYVDVEKSFDPAYAESLGLDLDRCIIVDPDSGEQTVDVAADLFGTSLPIWMIIDSVAHIVPSAEIEESADQQFIGTQARLINRFMRVSVARLKRSLYDSEAPKTTVIALNQLREKVGVMFGNPETTPGGKGKEFAYSMMIRLTAPPSEKITEKISRGGVERTVYFGNNVKFTINKNKTGGNQHEDGDFQYFKKPYQHYEAFTFNNDATLLKFGLFYEVIEETRSGYEAFGIVLPSKAKLAVKKIATLPKLQKKLYAAVMEKILEENRSSRSGILLEADDDEEEEEDEPRKKKPITRLITGKGKK